MSGTAVLQRRIPDSAFGWRGAVDWLKEVGFRPFMRYLIQPQVVNGYLKDGLGRWLPAMPELAKTDPFWLAGNDKHREAYTREGVLGPTVPSYSCYNPGYAEVEAAQLWGMAHADVIRDGMTPQAAADKAFKRIGEILAKYPVGQA